MSALFQFFLFLYRFLCFFLFVFFCLLSFTKDILYLFFCQSNRGHGNFY